MNELITAGGPAVTMTSLELVEFINSQRGEGEPVLAHSDFLKKVPQVLGGDAGKFSSVYLGGNGQERPCYAFPKREACLMAMSYSYDLQAKVFDRMTALEAAPPANPMELLRDPAVVRNLLLGYTERVMELETTVAQQTPKVQAFDRIATFSEGSYCLRDAAKVQQVPERKFIQYLDAHQWIYQQAPGQWRVYSDVRKNGLMEQKTTTGQKADGTEWQSVQVRVTAKGMAKLARVFELEGAPA